MFKQILVACVASVALTVPAKAQVFDSFDGSSFLGSGSVGLNGGGVSLSTGIGGVGVGANIGPGGVNGSFGGEGFGGYFNNNGVTVGTGYGIGGTFNTSGGYFNAPGINGNINSSGIQIGAGESSMNGSMSGGIGNGTLGSGANTGDMNHSAYNYTRGYQTQQTPAIGRTTRNNYQSVVQGTRNLNLPPTYSGGMAPVFGD